LKLCIAVLHCDGGWLFGACCYLSTALWLIYVPPAIMIEFRGAGLHIGYYMYHLL